MSPVALLARAWRLVTLLDGMRGRTVAVIGDAMLDVYLRGDVERISPEAPVPVVRVRDRRHALGGAANVAQNVAAGGARGILVAVAAADPAGAQLRAMLAGMGAPPRRWWQWRGRPPPRRGWWRAPSRWCASTRRTMPTSPATMSGG